MNRPIHPHAVLTLSLLLAGASAFARGHAGDGPPPPVAIGNPPSKPPRKWPRPLFAPEPAKRPPRAAVCFHAQLMRLNQAKQQNPGDDSAIVKAAARVQPPLTRFVAMQKSASRGMVMADADLSQIVVAFRGSLPPDEGEGWRDWVTNLAGAPLPVSLRKKGALQSTSAIFHGGFHDAASEYKPLVEDVRKLFDEAKRKGKPRPKLAITGHSLGGALAAIFAYFLAESDLAPDDFVIFGSPGVDLGSYADIFHSYVPWGSTRHYVVAGDPVVLLPPAAAKPPAREWELSAPAEPPPQGTIDKIKQRFLRHHVDVYVDKMEALCRASTDQMPRDFYDCFVRELGRLPTVREFEDWRRTLFVDKPEKSCRLAVEREKMHYKNIRQLFDWKIDRQPTADELKQYAAIIADIPRGSDGMSNAIKTLERSPAYYEWWLNGILTPLYNREPKTEEREYWLDKIAELGLEQASKQIHASNGVIR